ncbi:MAG: hypothetical protein AB8G11_21545 [Saprospiraceae bacterium]
MKIKLLNLILFCFLTQFLKAQDKGTVIFNVAPLEAIIKINNQTLRPANIGEPKTSIQLGSGEYKVQVWSFGMQLQETTISVTYGDTSSVNIALKPTKEYMVYRDELTAYKEAQSAIIAKQLPAIITSSIVTGTIISYAFSSISKLNKLENRLEIMRTGYNDAINPNTLDEFEKNYYDTRDEFNQNRKNYYLYTVIGSSVSLGLWGFTAYRLKKGFDGLNKPIFNDTNPLSKVNVNLKTERMAFENAFPSLSFSYQF